MRIRINWEDVAATVVIALVLAIIIYAAVFTVCVAKTELACAQEGWRDYTVTWNLEQFCVREENEYEIIKPLGEIRGE